MPGFLRKEPTIDSLEAESELMDSKLSVEEKKLLLAKLKQQYGEGSKGLFKGGLIKSGMDWESLKFKVGNTDRLRGKW